MSAHGEISQLLTLAAQRFPRESHLRREGFEKPKHTCFTCGCSTAMAPLPLSSPMSSPRTSLSHPPPSLPSSIPNIPQEKRRSSTLRHPSAKHGQCPCVMLSPVGAAPTGQPPPQPRCPQEPGFALNTSIFRVPRQREMPGSRALGGCVGSSSLPSPYHGSLSRQQEHLGLIRGKLCSGRGWRSPKSFALKGDVTAFPSSKTQDELFRPVAQQLC